MVLLVQEIVVISNMYLTRLYQSKVSVYLLQIAILIAVNLLTKIKDIIYFDKKYFPLTSLLEVK